MSNCSGWNRCPSRAFYLQLKRVFKKLRDSLLDLGCTDFATSDYERNLGLFSQPHLEYTLLRQFQRIRSVEAANDLPIVWATTQWRQNRYPRKACCIQFEPVAEVTAEPEDTTATAPQNQELGELETTQLSITNDNFWTVVKSSTLKSTGGAWNVSIYDVLGLRIVLHYISCAHRDMKGIILTAPGLNLFIRGLNITPDVNANIFWDGDNAKNYFKNGPFKNNKRKVTNEDLSESNLTQMKDRCEADDKLKVSWAAVLQNIDYAQVDRVYGAALAHEFDPDLPEFPILEEQGSIIGDEIDSRIVDDDTPLAPVLMFAASKGTVTRKLIQRLAILRVSWQQNRLKFGSLLLSGGAYTNEVARNTVLARANQFATASSQMILSKSGKLTIQRRGTQG